MFKTNSYQRMGIIIGCLSLSLTGCGISKVEQCNSFSEVINQGETFQTEFQTEMDEFGKKFGNTKDLAGMKEMANGYNDVVGRIVTKIDGMTGDLEALELPDETLSGQRDSYTKVTSGLSQALIKTTEAMSLFLDVKAEKDLMPVMVKFQEQATEAFKSIDSLSEQETKLTTEINAYCQGNAG
jgi:hypothetical protein